MAKFWGIAALAIFVLSLVCHLCTFIPSIPITMRMTWPLHLATILACGAMGISIVRWQKRQPRELAKGFFRKWLATNKSKRESISRIGSVTPDYLILTCVALLIYGAINFVIFMFLMEGGSPQIEDGQYVLLDHGRFIRELTPEEYQRFLAYEVRGFSGHWMFFSLIPTVYFLAVYPRLQALNPTAKVETV